MLESADSLSVFGAEDPDWLAARAAERLSARHIANALDLLLSARRVSSDEALRMGLVNRLCPPEKLREETFAHARDLADFVSPSSMAVIKRQLYDVPFQTLGEAMIDANREMITSLRGADFKEGVASFVEKRAPRFTGR